MDWMRDLEQSKAIYSRGLSNGGSHLVLAHDIHEMTVYSLAEYMINAAVEGGYKLVTVGDCLGDPRENWYRPYASSGSEN